MYPLALAKAINAANSFAFIIDFDLKFNYYTFVQMLNNSANILHLCNINKHFCKYFLQYFTISYKSIK